MEIKTFKYDFLISNGFKLLEGETSECFEDYYDTFSNDEVLIRFSSSRSFKTVDVGNMLDIGRWIDLALIKALENDEQDLSKITTVMEYNDFLVSHLSKICELLSNQNYSSTKKKIRVLEERRAKQLFPNN